LRNRWEAAVTTEDKESGPVREVKIDGAIQWARWARLSCGTIYLRGIACNI